MSLSIFFLLFVPLLGCFLLRFSSWGQSAPRVVAKWVAGIGLVAAIASLILQYTETAMPFWSSLGLGSDGFSHRLVVMYAFVFFLLVVLCPMSLSYRQEITLILLVNLGIILTLLSTHLYTYFLGCLVIAFPLYFKLRTRPQMEREAKLYLMYQGIGLFLLILAFLSLYADAPSAIKNNFLSIPLLVQHIHQIPISLRTAVLFGVAVLFRLGVWPFHFPLLLVFQRARYGGLIAYVLGHILITSMLKFGGILLTHTLQPVLSWILIILLLNALYFSLTSQAQQHLRRLIAYQCFSFLALAMTLFITPTSKHFLYCKIEVVTLSLVFGGLMSTLWLVESHMDVDHIEQYQGIAKRVPGLASFFLLFVLTTMGFPGTIGYIAEELVLQNRFHHSSWEGMLALVVVGFNAWVMFRCYVRLFLGPASESSHLGIPLSFREKLALLCILALVVCSGLVPDLLFRVS